MTLVVARVNGSRVSIASDTLLLENCVPLPLGKGTIKSCILPGGICVSFANSPELAWRDCWTFCKSYPEGIGFSETINFFEKSSKKTNNDYIVAFSQNAKIVKIADGRRVNSISKSLWIGDKKAYEKFREHETRSVKGYEYGRAINSVLFADEIDKSPASDLYSAMRHLVLDKSVDTVGGFVCLISNRDEGFRHSVYCDMLYDWPSGSPPDFRLDMNDKIDFGASGENQEYSVSQFSTGYLNFNCVGFYILPAKMAVLFYPSKTLLADSCEIFTNIEPSELSSRVSAKFGIDLGWLIFIAAAGLDRPTSKFRANNSRDTGVTFSFRTHANTFPPTGVKRILPPIQWNVPGDLR
jgi:hypothetical protein